MNSIKIKSSINKITSKEEWDKILGCLTKYDCYHTYGYHIIDKKNNEQPILVCYQSESCIIALPLLKRAIPLTNYYDATSVYGYAGPIFNEKTSEKDFDIFQKELQLFCREEKIISIFTRLNPYINNQEKCLKSLGRISEIGNVVNINLNKKLDEQRFDYSSTTKRYLNKARKFCTTKKSTSKKHLQTFMELYYENMTRVNAESQYFFDEKYFLNLLQSNDFQTEVTYAILKDTKEIISGIITIKVNKVIHYHLSGTKTKYLNLNPLRLLLDEVRISATNEKLNSLNLGGGLGAKQDSLYFFKSSFSKEVKKFKVWEFIANKEVYDSLVMDINTENAFFPAYRKGSLL